MDAHAETRGMSPLEREEFLKLSALERAAYLKMKERTAEAGFQRLHDAVDKFGAAFANASGLLRIVEWWARRARR